MVVGAHDDTDMSEEHDAELEIDRRYAEQAIWAPAYWREPHLFVVSLDVGPIWDSVHEGGKHTGCRTCVLVP